MRFGIDLLVDSGFEILRGRRVGAIVNPTSVDRHFRHLSELLAGAGSLTLAALFGPEHGVRGEAQYMVAVDGVAMDTRLGVPVHSLYGHTAASLTPTQGALAGLDALVFDIQDVGARYYTYLATMGLAMEAAGKAGVAFVVLDRPNPLGLCTAEGNLVREGFRSFVGQYPIPTRHALTAGELARWLVRSHGVSVELTVLPVEGLGRAHWWDATGRAFIPPSPNMPTPDTALVYPGMCLLEGTNLSEGRGTCRPFEQFGAPFLDMDAVAGELERRRLPGVTFRPCSFTPTFDKFAGQSCEGAFIHVVDREAFRALRTGVAVVEVCRQLGGDHFRWRADAYEFVDTVPAFDLLCGTDEVRLAMEAGRPTAPLLDRFDADSRDFVEKARESRLYEGA